MRKLKNKDSISLEFFSKQKEIEKYAYIGRMAHELFHDLLNPITGFLLYMDTFNERLDKKELVKQSKEINKSISRIKKFIELVKDNLTNKNIKNKIILEKEIRNIMLLLHYKAKINAISIILLSSREIKINIQKIKLYQIIINFLSNAIDSYEKIDDERRKQIIIKTEETNKYIKLSFTDNGCGIKREDLNKIFKLNYSNKEKGFGIGLKTVKKIIEDDLEGSIIVSSTLNKGTQFRIKIPKNHL